MKYKLTNNSKTVSYAGKQVTLTQIQALRDIPRHDVKAGDLGGWIKSEQNLAQNGDAWVYGEAWVSGNAWVHGDARVSGNAWVFGDAWVYDDAKVYGESRVYGESSVYGKARIRHNIGEGTYNTYSKSDELLDKIEEML